MTARALSSDTTAYTEGTDITLSSESDNGTKICFRSRDEAGNMKFETSNAIAGIDATEPVITVTSPDTMTSLSKMVSATDDDTGATTWLYKLIDGTAVCGSVALSSDTTVYTEGNTITFSSESDNGQKVCFSSRDAVGNTGFKTSTVIDGIDTTAPVITVSSPNTSPAPSKIVGAIDDDDRVTTWVYKLIDGATTCDNAALASDTTAYTEKSMIILASETNNGQKVCFSATDELNRTTYAASMVIDGIDTTLPERSTGEGVPGRNLFLGDVFFQLSESRPSHLRKSQILIRTFEFGDQSQYVLEAQRILNTRTPCIVATEGPGSPGRETTFLGSRTTQALYCFQRLWGLRMTGTLTSETYSTLVALTSSESLGENSLEYLRGRILELKKLIAESITGG